MDKSTVDALHLAKYPEWLIGLLASGGSAFWTNVLGYLSGLKDLSAQKAFQAKFLNDAQKALPLGVDKIKTDTIHKASVPMKSVRFTAAFTEAPGTLSVTITNGPQINFNADGYQDVDLPVGKVDFTVSGAASPGPEGGATLTIDGVRNSNSPLKYGPGIINVDNQTMSV
ncbi:hypothetical protein [Mucilaginibacter sp. OK098]|uniref:hypothetical protein n=1 Tax=Mucilaginibacter sp. OK098 TaxID=1855297 RepID=UPI0009343B1F|nr:hypothetical protein [Mucilaginibacter sp. OK098]